jgi:hypothetical protein
VTICGAYLLAASSSASPFRSRPEVAVGRERIGAVWSDDERGYRVLTDRGVIAVDTAGQTAEFGLFDPRPLRRCSPACAGFTGKLKRIR